MIDYKILNRKQQKLCTHILQEVDCTYTKTHANSLLFFSQTSYGPWLFWALDDFTQLVKQSLKGLGLSQGHWKSYGPQNLWARLLTKMVLLLYTAEET